MPFHDTYGNVPIVPDVSTAIHEFGHMLFMPFGIPILGTTMVILGGSLTEVAFPLLFVGYFLRRQEDGRRRDVFAAMVCTTVARWMRMVAFLMCIGSIAVAVWSPLQPPPERQPG